MFLFRRGQTLSCPPPWWRHSWYRPVVIVYSWPPPPRLYSSIWTQTSNPPPHPSLDDDTLKIRPFKHRYSNKLSHVQYVIQWGFDHFTESARLKTHERHYLYTEDTVTVRGWPRMDLAASWRGWGGGWSARWKEHSADGERRTTGTSNGGEWQLSKIFQKRYPNVSWPPRNAREHLPLLGDDLARRSPALLVVSCSCREIVC